MLTHLPFSRTSDSCEKMFFGHIQTIRFREAREPKQSDKGLCCAKSTLDSKGSDQTAQMRSLIRAFVVHILREGIFSCGTACMKFFLLNLTCNCITLIYR